jgi:hypothetical protein
MTKEWWLKKVPIGEARNVRRTPKAPAAQWRG